MSQLTAEELTALKSKAKDVRIDILKMITKANSGHTGGSLSAADILTLLFFHEMKVDPKDPKKADRDRLVLSKGHAAPALYAVLAEKGYFPKEELDTLRQAGHMLQGHPDMKHTPGVDMTTGSLGQGISAACGMALASKMNKADWRVYAILGDGELEEGQVWEAAMYAAHYKLDHLTAFVDNNGLQIGTFSNWRATQFHPRAHRLDGVMHLPNNARNILAPPVSQALSVAVFSIGGLVFPCHRLFWISYVI